MRSRRWSGHRAGAGSVPPAHRPAAPDGRPRTSAAADRHPSHPPAPGCHRVPAARPDAVPHPTAHAAASPAGAGAAHRWRGCARWSSARLRGCPGCPVPASAPARPARCPGPAPRHGRHHRRAAAPGARSTLATPSARGLPDAASVRDRACADHNTHARPAQAPQLTLQQSA